MFVARLVRIADTKTKLYTPYTVHGTYKAEIRYNALAIHFQDNPIALDWINQNVYWIDIDPAANHIAIISMSNGKFTRLLTGLNIPTAIAVSPQLGYISLCPSLPLSPY